MGGKKGVPCNVISAVVAYLLGCSHLDFGWIFQAKKNLKNGWNAQEQQ